jgi:hypothetical protein
MSAIVRQNRKYRFDHFSFRSGRQARQSRPARIRSSTLLEDGPCYGGVSHAPLLGDGPGTLALSDALASDTPLQLGHLGLATHVNPTLAGTSSAVVGTLQDPLAFVLRQGAQESDEAAIPRLGW